MKQMSHQLSVRFREKEMGEQISQNRYVSGERAKRKVWWYEISTG